MILFKNSLFSFRPPNIESRCAQLLANYSDSLLRKYTKHLTTEEVDEKLSNLLLVLKYVRNKDVFMRYYKTHLSHRLIFEMTTDQEREEQLVARFRESGIPAEFVRKLFRMLQDIEVNKDLNAELKRYLASTAGTGHGGAHHPLPYPHPAADGCEGAQRWCLEQGSDGCGGAVEGLWYGGGYGLELPVEMGEYLGAVESYYAKKHTGRRLNWAHHWSTGTVGFMIIVTANELIEINSR